MILYSMLVSYILIIASLNSCFGDLKPIQIFDSTCLESFYGISSGAMPSLNNLIANTSIALRHDSNYGIIFKAGRDGKYYKIKRSDKGGLDINSNVYHADVSNSFNNYGIEFLDVVYYQKVKSYNGGDEHDNTQLSGDDDVRVVCIDEGDASKDPNFEYNKFKRYFIRIRYDEKKKEIQRSEIDIKDLAKKFKKVFNENMAASIAKKIGFRDEDLIATDLNGQIQTVKLNKENKKKIKTALKNAKCTEKKETKIEIPAGYEPKNILFIKIDRGAYILIRCTNGVPIVASYEIVSGKENVYVYSFE